ncbi:unnamed protein product [Strongylus vulgaris]|uniref:Uncharacterized protein n=1 Tax=Strongylus vulgaris TaxID=40348 RepID=A0A3P7L1L0_STRVU|nr:unnamed protein product [Strongylus vulgaris]
MRGLRGRNVVTSRMARDKNASADAILYGTTDPLLDKIFGKNKRAKRQEDFEESSTEQTLLRKHEYDANKITELLQDILSTMKPEGQSSGIASDSIQGEPTEITYEEGASQEPEPFEVYSSLNQIGRPADIGPEVADYARLQEEKVVDDNNQTDNKTTSTASAKTTTTTITTSAKMAGSTSKTTENGATSITDITTSASSESTQSPGSSGSQFLCLS